MPTNIQNSRNLGKNSGRGRGIGCRGPYNSGRIIGYSRQTEQMLLKQLFYNANKI